MSESTQAQKIQEQPELNTVYPLAVAAPTPMSILARAVADGADLDKIERLMALQEKYERREAEKAFVHALAAFKKNPPEIIKNKKVEYETKSGDKISYKHATLDRVTTLIGGALGDHGLSARWRTVQADGKIRVTCILQHEMGHAEETTLEGPPDDSGMKNPVQRISSTVTFLERYTLLAATGMATRDDADGITFGDAEDMVANLQSAATVEELQDRFNKAYKRAYAAKDKSAMAICIETKDQRKKDLEDPAKRKAREEFDAKWEKRGVNQAGRQMAIGKNNGDLTAADKELEASLANAPATPPPGPQEPEAKKGRGKPKKESKGSRPEDSKPQLPASKDQENLGF